MTLWRRLSYALAAGVALAATLAQTDVRAQVTGPNVNMVAGKTLPDGDPFLQRQNEPSGAMSSRNPLTLFAGANDYRTVDLPGLPNTQDDEGTGDAWLGVYKSFNGGQTWRSSLVPGYPQDTSPEGRVSPLKGYQAGADPTVRAGTHGLFYYSGIVFNRGANGLGLLFVARYLDNNNKAGADSIAYLGTTVVDSGNKNKFIDHPNMVVDIPRADSGVCTIRQPGMAAQKIPAGTIYMSYVVFAGTTTSPTSKLMVTRSGDCGVTWAKPTKVSERSRVNQGVAMAINPVTGRLSVAWREFASEGQPDAILFAQSTDHGKKWTDQMKFRDPMTVATISPFDQGNTATTFRTNSYPTLAMDGTGRIYLAWTERGLGPADPVQAGQPNPTVPPGDARIVLTTSQDGLNWTPRKKIENDKRPKRPKSPLWTAPQPVENESGRGHQIMPVATFVAGKLSIFYYDLREDESNVFKTYIDELNIFEQTPAKRHTLDVRIMQADPGDVPVFEPSVPVSRYMFGSRPGQRSVEQLQFNVPNLPLYSQGALPFIGDYIDLAGQTFVPPARATGSWTFNTASTGPGALHAFWTDNRDVRPPKDGNWTHYTPPTSTFTLQACAAGQTGMRNANIYTAVVTPGLFAGSPSNSKRLSATVARSFVVFAQNNTDVTKRYRFAITNQPAGGQASFLQFSPPGDPLKSLDAVIPPRSSASRTVYVTSTDPGAKVLVDIIEVQVSQTPNPPPVPGGLTASVPLNPDVTNPDVTNPDVTNNEVFNPDVTNPDVTNPDVTNPDVTNPDVTNPDVTNVNVANPDVTNPDVTNPDVTNPDVTNPDVTNPDVTNQGVSDGAFIDTTWTVTNKGNAAGSFAVKPLLTKQAPAGFLKQLILHKTYTTPVTTTDNCEIKTVTQNILITNVANLDTLPSGTTTTDPTNPDVTNATVWLEPGESAKITFRLLAPDRNALVRRTVTQSDGTLATVLVDPRFEPARDATPIVQPQAVDTVLAEAGITTPPVVIALVISTTTLADAVATLPYSQTLTATGGADGPRTWRVPSCSGPTPSCLPPGLTLNTGTGEITGAPTAVGEFLVTVEVMDAATPTPHVNSRQLAIRVVPFATAQSVTTPEDRAYDVTLSADGIANSLLAFTVTQPPAHGTLSGEGATRHYTPNQDYNGPDTFGFTATLPALPAPLTSPPATISVTVTPVNDPPTFVLNAVPPSSQNAGPQSVTGVATNFSPGPPDEAAQPLLRYVVVGNTNPALFSAPPTIDNAGTLRYTAARDRSGAAVISVTAQDGGGVAVPGLDNDTSAPQQLTITVTTTNQTPAAAADNYTTNEDTTLIASGCTAPINYSALSSGSPFLTIGGDASFTATDADGSVLRLISTASGFGQHGAAWTRPRISLSDFHTTFRFRMSGNAAPFAPDPSAGWDGQGPGPDGLVFVLQNAPAGVLALGGQGGDLVTGITPSVGIEFDTFQSAQFDDPDSNHIGIDINGDNRSIITVPVATRFDDGELWTAWIDYDGTTLEVRASPSGVRPEAPALSYTIDLASTLGDPFANAGFAAADGSNIADVDLVSWSSTCTPRNVLSNDTDVDGDPLTAIMFAPPDQGGTVQLNSDGTFAYTPAPNFSGVERFAYSAFDGTSTSAPAIVTMTVNPVNDAPSFAKGADVTTRGDGESVTIPGWATAISAGPADEIGQTVTFVVSNGNNPLFTTQPSVDTAGTLSFTTVAGAAGVAIVTVRAHDTGGTAFGGVDTSAPQTFQITVTGTTENRSPTANDDVAATDENTTVSIPVLANDTDPDNDPLHIVAIAPTMLGSATPEADGTITYIPPPNFAGVEVFSYRIADSQGGVSNLATVTVTVNATGPATFVVTSTNDVGPGSLRAALLAANASGFDASVTFNIPGAGVHTIAPLSPLPFVTIPMTIDGYTQPGSAVGAPTVEIDGSAAGPNAAGMGLIAASTVRGLSIYRFSNGSIVAGGAGGHRIVGNYIGIDSIGLARGNINGGISLASGNNLVGGTEPGDRNIVSGNDGPGIVIGSGVHNVIRNNYVGTNAAGTAPIRNGGGIEIIDSSDNEIVGNVISGNDAGIVLRAGTGANNAIRGNVIGTNASATAAVPNNLAGILVFASDVNIGGNTTADRNIISGNTRYGIQILNGATNITIRGNYIGTDATGGFAIPNMTAGITLSNATNVVIGGLTAGAGNVISGNGTATVFGEGISIFGGGSNVVQANLVGTNATGTLAVPNVNRGVSIITSNDNTIGGTTPAARNVISGNGAFGFAAEGISVFGASTGNLIAGNYIGTDITGSNALGNSGRGVTLSQTSTRTVIGGATPGAGNVISGNGTPTTYGAGINVFESSVLNVIQGNLIGTNAAGSAPVPNANEGVRLDTGSNTVGGTGLGAGNTIAYNTGAGVLVTNGTRDTIQGNAIFANGGIGIDLSPEGVTPNDSGDADTGANNLQNFPVLQSVVTTGGQTTVAGTLNSTASSVFTIELFSGACNAGPTFRGSFAVTTGADGNASFAQTFPFALPSGGGVTATATDAAGNTSEFSACAAAVVNQTPTATDDSISTTSNTPATWAPASNDFDVDNPSPHVIGSFKLLAPGQKSLINPGAIAVVAGTGLAYVNAGPGFGVIDTATNAVVATIPYVGGGTPVMRANPATGFVYAWSSPNVLLAIDARPASPAFNTVALATTIGAQIQSFALDPTRGLLYVSNQINAAPGVSVFQSQITIVDVNPSSASFHQVVDSVAVPFGAIARGVAVNTLTNVLYIATNLGVGAMDGATHAITVVAGNTSNAFMPAVNEVANLVYVTANNPNQVFVIDGAANARLAAAPLPGSANANFDRRIVVSPTTGRVYVAANEFPAESHVVVIDGTRASPTFATVLAQVPIGREDGRAELALDEAVNRLAANATIDFRTTVIDTATNAIVGSVTSSQPMMRVDVNRATHTALVTGSIGFVQAIGLSSGALTATIPMGGLVAFPAINPNRGQALVPETSTSSFVAVFDAFSAQPNVSGLPTEDGQYAFAAVDASRNLVYVTNSASAATGGAAAMPGFVSVIDGATNTVVATVPAGNFPNQLTVDEAANKIYVGNQFNGPSVPGGITIIRGDTRTTSAANLAAIPLSVGFVPGQLSVARDIIVNPATGKVYFRVTNGSSVTAAVLDGGSNSATPLAGITSANIIRVNPILNRIYIGDQVNGVNIVHVLDGSVDNEIAALPLGPNPLVGGTPSYLAVNRATGRVWVANNALNTVTVVDGTNNTVLASIHVGRSPNTVAVDETTNHVFVGNWVDGTVTIIDGASLRVVSTIQLPYGPGPNCPPGCGQLRVTANPGTSTFYASWTGENGSEPVVMILADPVNPNGPLSVISVTQGAHGTVTLNADGTVTYTPDAGYTGSDSYTYTVSDGHGGTTTGTVTIAVADALRMVTSSIADSTVGSTYAQTFRASGGSAPYTWTIIPTTGQQLPAGLVLSGNGVLSGRILASGTFTFVIEVRDSSTPFPQSVTRQFTIVVGPPVVTTTALPAAVVGTPYSQQLTYAGTTAAVTWTLNTFDSPLLAWLSLAPTGLLTGTPPAYDNPTPSFTVTVTDASGQSGSRSLSVTVGGPLELSAATPREGVVLETEPALQTIGGNGSKLFTLTGGSMPPGVTFNANGSFSGAPTRHGSFPFTVQIQDCASNSCAAGTPQQTISRSRTWRVSAKDQQSGSQSSPDVPFGATAGKLAQVFTVGAHGTLTGIGLTTVSCPSFGPVTVEIQHLTLAGLPGGDTIASGTAATNLNAIAITPPVDLPIDARLAFVLSSPSACAIQGAPGSTDLYQAGDAYVDQGTGSGWRSLFSVYAQFDLPFRSLIQPAMDVAYLNRSRGAHTATLLNTGKVLLAGNDNTAEMYDPASDTSASTGSMSQPRSNHTATLLLDGAVLIAGGRDFTGTRAATAEIYDPSAGSFTPTAGPMSAAREFHTATRLVDGRVLIAGGIAANGGTLQSAEIYDPASKTFGPLLSMTTPRQSHTAVLLQSGKVLIAGGFGNAFDRSAELFDPATTSFTPTAHTMVAPNRGRPTATLLDDGTVLIAGGQSGDIVASAETYDPAADSFTATAGAMTSKRHFHTATLLPDHSVLIAGGDDETTVSNYILPLASVERYLPASRTFVPAGGLEARRGAHTATALPNGKVFIAGGFSQSWMTGNTGELYDRASTPVITTTSLPDGQPGTPYTTTTLTASGGTPPYAITQAEGLLAPGLNYDAPSFTLSGTPTTTGVFPVGFKVTDSAARSSVSTLSVRVGVINAITSPYRLTDGALNHDYDVLLTATGAPDVAWSLLPGSNPLPAGLRVGTTGRITGTPTTTGFFNFVVRAVDATGQAAIKTLSINIQNPIQITTSALADGVLFEGYNQCIGTTNGVGNRTFLVSAGSPPTGVTLGQFGCFFGSPAAFGTSTFTVQVTDSASPPEVLTQVFTIAVTTAVDQGSSWNALHPVLPFGSGTRLAERVITGVTGTLRALRINSVSCSTGTLVTAEIQGIAAAGSPNGIGAASGAASFNFSGGNFNLTIPLTTPLDFRADEPFTVVFSADQNCVSYPTLGDTYPGEGYVSTNAGGPWQRLPIADGRDDIPFQTLVQPAAGLTLMQTWRGGHTATTLGDGRVLVAGNGTTAEIYDPASGAFTQTGNLHVWRNQHTATLLNDGTVLITGGVDQSTQPNVYLASAELFHPETGTFELLPAAPSTQLSAPRARHTATALADGRVLIAGGSSSDSGGTDLATAEIYTPASKTFTPVASQMQNGSRQQHTATRLLDGRVLIAGGWGGGFGRAEYFDPVANSFQAITQPMRPHATHTATLLQDGRVLVAGGAGDNGNSVDYADLFNPATNTFTPAGTMTAFHVQHTATLLADGSVLLAGGVADAVCCYPHASQAILERYVPGTGFVGAGQMLAARTGHTAAMLSNGKVLFTGGWGYSSLAGRSAELYDQGSTPGILNPALPDGAKDVPYGPAQLAAIGGSGQPYTWTLVSPAAALPPGLTFDTVSCVVGCTLTGGTPISGPVQLARISGTPTAYGTYAFDVRVTDNGGHAATQPLSIRINGLTITTTSLPIAHIAQPYSTTLTATGVGALTWTVTAGSLPPGLSLSGNTISGTPANPATFYGFTVKVIDSLGQQATKSLNINVAGPLTIQTVSLEDAVLFGGYGGCVNVTNVVGNFTVAITAGSPPNGISMNANGCFFGSASAFGTFAFTVTATDSTSQTASQPLSIAVSSALEQSASSDSGQPALPFGGAVQIAEHVTAGVTGSLRGLRLMSLTCPIGTMITAEIHGLDPSGAPNGSTLASGSAIYNFNFPNPTLTVWLNSPLTFAADAEFAVLFGANGNCSVRPSSQNSYPGDGYISNSGGWQRLDVVDGRSDIPFQTLVMPVDGLTLLTTWRYNHTATALADGRILITGPDRAAEIYDPSTGVSTATGDMTTARNSHRAVLLGDGTVLITGGLSIPPNAPNVYLSSAELFHPDTGTFELLTAAMGSARAYHTATKLDDARVLIAGGVAADGGGQELQTAEIYVPASRTFTPLAATMTSTRQQHTATVLNDHRVLLAGGWGNPFARAELFDPIANTFTQIVQPMPPHAMHTATLLPDGRVLLAGGGGQNGGVVNYADLFDPVTLTFTPAGTMTAFRAQHTATLLRDGSVLLAGGTLDNTCCDPHAPQASLERYVPGSGFIGAGSMIAVRAGHTASLLPNGSVLLAGTWGWSSLSGRSAETYQPASSPGVLNPNLPDGLKDVAYGPVTLGASGGAGRPYSLALISPPSALPPGLTFDTVSCVLGCTVTGGTPVSGPTDLGRISGVPTAYGSYAFDVRVTDSAGHAKDQTLRIRINGLDILTPVQLPDAHVNQFYNATLSATGIGPWSWSIVANSLPPGLGLSGNTISGTPTGSGYYSFTARVVDALGQRATKSIAINVLGPVIPSQPPPQPQFNNAGPGAMLVSYFNPAPTGDAASLPSHGTEATVTFFNPAPVAQTQPPLSTGAAAAGVSYANGANPPPPAEASTVNNTMSPAVSFANGSNPSPPTVTPAASNALAAAVSFANGSNPDPSGGSGGTGAPGASLGVATFASGPTITDVSPAQLSASGAPPTLVLTGANFANVTTVTLSDSTGITLGSFAISNDGHTLSIPLTLTATSETRTVTISVSGPDGSSPVTAATVFIVVP